MSVNAAGMLLSASMSARLNAASAAHRETLVKHLVAELHRRRREALRKKKTGRAEKLRDCLASP
jgi:hypothetical protein